MDRRVPPHHMAAEEALAGAAMLNPEALAAARAAGLAAADFYGAATGRAWAAICDLADAGERPDTVAVAAALDAEHGGDSLDRLLRWQADSPSSAGAETWARAVIGAARRRAVIAAGRDISEIGWTATGGDEAVAAAAETVAALDRSPRGGPVQIADAVDAMLARWDDPDGGHGIGFGIAPLDRVLTMRPGEVHVVGARTAVGKSSFMLAAAAHCARHHGPVLVFSLEMTAAEIAARVLAHVGRVPVQSHTGPAGGDEWRRVTAALPDMASMDVWIDDQTAATVDQVRAAAAMHQARHGRLALIVVDYLQLLTPQPGHDTRTLELAAVMRGLKVAARALGCPILTASQVRREAAATNAPPRLTDLRESGAIEQDADAVVMLHRPDQSGSSRQHGAGPDIETAQPIDLWIAKNRHGPQARIRCEWYPAWATIAVAAARQHPPDTGTSERRSEWLPYRD